MTEPVCRVCWMGTLTPAQQERVKAEADTMPSHYCDDHQQIINNMLDSIGWSNIKIMGSVTGRFPREPQPQFRPVGYMDEKGIERA